MIDTQVLERFSPPHVLVNRDGDVVYYSARTGKYLEAAAGVPTRQIFTMARKGIRLELRTVFREAVESGRAVTRDGIAIEEEDGRVQVVSLTVEPLGSGSGVDPLYLVLFVDQGPVLSREEALSRAHATTTGTALQMEHELRETRERLQSVIEEYETALEELKSSNEELVSVNEELQSTNEEIKASKEELVSLNEELHTVNTELNGKIEALDRARSDLQNLFDSTAVATVFLDRKLVIRSFTPAMSEVFNIRAADRGRPITDLASRLRLTGFDEAIASVVADGEIIESQVDSEDRQMHYLVRLAPYRNGNDRADGVVVTFLNVTNLTRAEQRQKVLVAELQHRTRNLLAIVESIALRTLAKGAPLEAFTTRLSALGRLQGLLGKASDEQVELGEIVRMEIETIAGGVAEKVAISGPTVPLGLEYVQNIALAVHELATNAVKYGALKSDEGCLEVSWRLKDGHQDHSLLILEWRESGLSEPPESTRRGFGRQLIEQALPFSLRAKAELAFAKMASRAGLPCRSDRSGAPTSIEARETTMGQSGELQGRRILVVEDDFLVAQGLCGMLEEAGATIVGPFGWADEALKLVETHMHAFDSAVLDVDLHGEKSYPIADWLAGRDVRFVFTTGYGADALDPGYLHYPRCEKPFDVRMLFKALARN